nr:hypothetical protein [Tanacetum cinerariifolium]
MEILLEPTSNKLLVEVSVLLYSSVEGGAIVYTRWIDKMESVYDMSGCEDNQKVKYTAGSFVGKVLTWWNSQIHTRSREAVVEMAWEDFKTLTREEFCLINEMQKLEIEFWNHVIVGAGHAAYTDRFHELARLVPHLVTPENKRIERKLVNVKDDSKRTRTGNAYAITTNPVRREYTGMVPKCTNCNLHHFPESPCCACFSFNRIVHLAKDCRVVPRMVNPINARNLIATRGACFECGGTDHFKLNQAQRPKEGRLNQVMTINEGQGRGNNGNQACGEAFMLGSEEACQDSNIMTGTFTLNNHYAIILFDSGVSYSFVSTTFTPLLGIKSSNLGFSYAIEIASEQLVKIDKVIRGCKLEIEKHTFDIDLIPFGSGSFDVIVEMDWFSKHKAKIICHEKVVRIPLRNGKTLRVVGERPDEKVRHLRSAKAKEQKKEDIVVVRNFPEEDLKIKFLRKYCLPARTTKKIEDINNFQQELDETLYQAWERFKELLMKCLQHYLMEMHEDVNNVKEPTTPKIAHSRKKVKPSKKLTTLNLVDLSMEGNKEQQLRDSSRGTMQTFHRIVKYPKGIAENVLVGIGKFVFLVDFIILDMPEDVKVPLILRRPFLSTAHANINVFKRNITLRVVDEKIIFKSVKHASSFIKRVYMLSLRERMELDLEARLMGETLLLNRSLDPLYEDYIESNDLNVPLELRRNQVNDLIPTIKEGDVIDEPMIDIIKSRNNEIFDEDPSFFDFDRKIHIDCAYNLNFLVENIDGYQDQDMGDIILGEPFGKASCLEARRQENPTVTEAVPAVPGGGPGGEEDEREVFEIEEVGVVLFGGGEGGEGGRP